MSPIEGKESVPIDPSRALVPINKEFSPKAAEPPAIPEGKKRGLPDIKPEDIRDALRSKTSPSPSEPSSPKSPAKIEPTGKSTGIDAGIKSLSEKDSGSSRTQEIDSATMLREIIKAANNVGLGVEDFLRALGRLPKDALRAVKSIDLDLADLPRALGSLPKETTVSGQQALAGLSEAAQDALSEIIKRLQEAEKAARQSVRPINLDAVQQAISHLPADTQAELKKRLTAVAQDIADAKENTPRHIVGKLPRPLRRIISRAARNARQKQRPPEGVIVEVPKDKPLVKPEDYHKHINIKDVLRSNRTQGEQREVKEEKREKPPEKVEDAIRKEEGKGEPRWVLNLPMDVFERELALEDSSFADDDNFNLRTLEFSPIPMPKEMIERIKELITGGEYSDRLALIQASLEGTFDDLSPQQLAQRFLQLSGNEIQVAFEGMPAVQREAIIGSIPYYLSFIDSCLQTVFEHYPLLTPSSIIGLRLLNENSWSETHPAPEDADTLLAGRIPFGTKELVALAKKINPNLQNIERETLEQIFSLCFPDLIASKQDDAQSQIEEMEKTFMKWAGRYDRKVGLVLNYLWAHTHPVRLNVAPVSPDLRGMDAIRAHLVPAKDHRQERKPLFTRASDPGPDLLSSPQEFLLSVLNFPPATTEAEYAFLEKIPRQHFRRWLSAIGDLYPQDVRSSVQKLKDQGVARAGIDLLDDYWPWKVDPSVNDVSTIRGAVVLNSERIRFISSLLTDEADIRTGIPINYLRLFNTQRSRRGGMELNEPEDISVSEWHQFLGDWRRRQRLNYFGLFAQNFHETKAIIAGANESYRSLFQKVAGDRFTCDLKLIIQLLYDGKKYQGIREELLQYWESYGLIRREKTPGGSPLKIALPERYVPLHQLSGDFDLIAATTHTTDSVPILREFQQYFLEATASIAHADYVAALDQIESNTSSDFHEESGLNHLQANRDWARTFRYSYPYEHTPKNPFDSSLVENDQLFKLKEEHPDLYEAFLDSTRRRMATDIKAMAVLTSIEVLRSKMFSGVAVNESGLTERKFFYDELQKIIDIPAGEFLENLSRDPDCYMRQITDLFAFGEIAVRVKKQATQLGLPSGATPKLKEEKGAADKRGGTMNAIRMQLERLITNLRNNLSREQHPNRFIEIARKINLTIEDVTSLVDAGLISSEKGEELKQFLTKRQ